MTLNKYRDFWESVFSSEIEHHENDQSVMNEEEKLSLINKSKRFNEVYYECFWEYPPECIWPELTLESWNQDDDFIFINLYKTLKMKISISANNLHKGLVDHKQILNNLNSSERKTTKIWKSVKGLIRKFKKPKIYKPAQDSYEITDFNIKISKSDYNFEEANQYKINK